MVIYSTCSQIKSFQSFSYFHIIGCFLKHSYICLEERFSWSVQSQLGIICSCSEEGQSIILSRPSFYPYLQLSLIDWQPLSRGWGWGSRPNMHMTKHAIIRNRFYKVATLKKLPLLPDNVSSSFT